MVLQSGRAEMECHNCDVGRKESNPLNNYSANKELRSRHHLQTKGERMTKLNKTLPRLRGSFHLGISCVCIAGVPKDVRCDSPWNGAFWVCASASHPNTATRYVNYVENPEMSPHLDLAQGHQHPLLELLRHLSDYLVENWFLAPKIHSTAVSLIFRKCVALLHLRWTVWSRHCRLQLCLRCRTGNHIGGWTHAENML